ncbi:winged helix DNA-binding domain-containing protein [Chitinophaga sp. 30R24]|uniref:winged helix DNA-binding domain-containing protein n=1 Tax=Chitinophaga sp. 30R24 TaxID=3248838 RepID=UPI003B91AC2B
MVVTDIAPQRLLHQQLIATPFTQPHEIVACLGAMQAQEYASSKWGIGIRLPGITNNDIEAAICNKTIIRTTIFRGTLHWVAAADLRWMLQLAESSVMTRMGSMHRKLGLDAAYFKRTGQVLRQALEGGMALTRKELVALLQKKGINTDENRMNHILYHAAINALICNGPLKGKQLTYVLLDEWYPDTTTLSRETALQTLAYRYFKSHGPATLADFAQWSGLPVAAARLGLEAAQHQLVAQHIHQQQYWMAPGKSKPPADTAFLLPAFDEFFIGYKDRSPLIDMRYVSRVITLNGIFNPIMVHNGQVVGVWKRTFKKDTVTIATDPFQPLKKAELSAFEQAAHQYAVFMGLQLAGFC